MSKLNINRAAFFVLGTFLGGAVLRGFQRIIGKAGS